MRVERLTEGEVLAAVREQGVAAMGDVEAVVIETAGWMSVLKKSEGQPSALRQVLGVPVDAGQFS